MTVGVAVLGRRACAVLAAGSAALHGVSLAHITNFVVLLVTVVMLVACLACARDLWIHGTLRTWTMVALMNLAMLAIHIPAHAHHSPVMTLATVLAAIEVVAATAVVAYDRAECHIRAARNVKDHEIDSENPFETEEINGCRRG